MLGSSWDHFGIILGPAGTPGWLASWYLIINCLPGLIDRLPGLIEQNWDCLKNLRWQSIPLPLAGTVAVIIDCLKKITGWQSVISCMDCLKKLTGWQSVPRALAAATVYAPSACARWCSRKARLSLSLRWLLMSSSWNIQQPVLQGQQMPSLNLAEIIAEMRLNLGSRNESGCD